MPKLPTAKRLKQVYACPPDKCNAKRHMPATTVMKVWDVMTGFAAYWQKNNDGRLIFSASVRPTLANAVPCEPQTADEAIAWLLANDWLVLEEKSRRRRDNTLGPNTYRLRTHDEYVKVHPGNCPPYPCRPNFEAEPIKVPARKMSLAERDQWLKFSPQAAPVRQIFAEMDAIWSALSDEERRAVVEAEYATPVMAGATPVQTGQDQSGYGMSPSPVMAGKPLRFEPEVSLLITEIHHTHTIPEPAARVCGVLTSNTSTKEVDTPLADKDPGLQPTAKPSPVVETVSAARAAELVGFLLNTGDGHGNILTIRGKQRPKLEALAIKYGEETFRQACRVWIKESPWNAQTIAPYMSLIDGFEGYVARAKRIAWENSPEKAAQDAAIIKASTEAAAKAHAKIWVEPDREQEKRDKETYSEVAGDLLRGDEPEKPKE